MSMFATGYHCKSYLSVQLSMRDGRLTPLLGAVFSMPEQEQLGWSPSWADSRGPAQPPVPVQHQIHSKWAFPTPPLIFLIQTSYTQFHQYFQWRALECWHSKSKDNQVHLFCIVLNFSVKITRLHTITEYSRLDEIHKDHWVTTHLSECPVQEPETLVSLASCSDQVKYRTDTQPLSTDSRGLYSPCVWLFVVCRYQIHLGDHLLSQLVPLIARD